MSESTADETSGRWMLLLLHIAQRSFNCKRTVLLSSHPVSAATSNCTLRNEHSRYLLADHCTGPAVGFRRSRIQSPAMATGHAHPTAGMIRSQPMVKPQPVIKPLLNQLESSIQGQFRRMDRHQTQLQTVTTQHNATGSEGSQTAQTDAER